MSPVRRPPSWSPPPLVRASLWLHTVAVLALVIDPALWPALLALIVADHVVMGAAGMMPKSQALGPALVRLPPASAQRGEIALTFDDGPDPEVTPRILELLARHGARASFFLIGCHAHAHPDLVEDILAGGHSVENHTETHPALFAALGPGALRREIAVAGRSLAAHAPPPRFFRAPMGLRSPLLDPALARLGLVYAGWTRRGLDGVDGNPETILARLTRGLAAGDILMLHDGRCARTPEGAPVVLSVLPRLLDCCAARGLRAVSLPMALG